MHEYTNVFVSLALMFLIGIVLVPSTTTPLFPSAIRWGVKSDNVTQGNIESLIPIETFSEPAPVALTVKGWQQRNGLFSVKTKTGLYQDILGSHQKICRDISSYSKGFALHGASELSCGWDRFWIQSLNAQGTPRCKGGDFYLLRMQSKSMKLAVDRIVDLDNGLYEVTVYVPHRGSFHPQDPIEICVDLTLSNAIADDGIMDHFAINSTTLGRTFRLPHYQYLKHDSNRASCVLRKPLADMCSHTAKYACSSKSPPKPTCTREHNVVPGSWQPQGPPGWNASMWYYPNECHLRYYSPEAARVCLNRKWIVGWGDSTMKQAMSNFLEDHLNLSVVEGVYMRDIDTLRQTLPKKKRAKLPNFFTYRQWDRNVSDIGTSSLRVSMAWGGCLWVSATPGCPDVAMRNRAYLGKLLSGSGPLPDMITMTHHIWRYPWHDEPDFIRLVLDTEKWIHSFYTRRNVPLPLLIWNNAPKIANDEHWNRCRLPAETFQQHLSWSLEDALHDAGSKVVFVDRWALTYPFHYDSDGFVHTGVHYGSTLSMCMTGLAYKRIYDPATCVRNTYPEKVMVQVWLNMICNNP
jgi:hypothetical protein